MRRINIPDKMSAGFLVGFVFPLIVFLVVFLISSGDKSLADYLVRIKNRDVVTHFISLCVFPNVFAFLLFNRFNKYQSAKGVLGMTILWALLVFLIKMV